MSRTPDPGDQATTRFEEMFIETRVPILGYLLRRAERPADAADLLGEVYLIAWRRFDDVPDGADARLWLYATARRVLANYHRRQVRQVQLGDRLRAELEVHLGAGSPQPSAGHPLAEALASSLEELSTGDRELIRLNIWEGLTPAEIGRVTEQSAGAVRVRLHRIRRTLAGRLATRSDTRSRHIGIQAGGTPG